MIIQVPFIEARITRFLSTYAERIKTEVDLAQEANHCQLKQAMVSPSYVEAFGAYFTMPAVGSDLGTWQVLKL